MKISVRRSRCDEIVGPGGKGGKEEGKKGSVKAWVLDSLQKVAPEKKVYMLSFHAPKKKRGEAGPIESLRLLASGHR